MRSELKFKGSGIGSKLTYYQTLYFTSSGHTLESKALANYFSTLDYGQHSQHWVEILGAMPLAANGKGANFCVEEVDDLVTFYYYRDEDNYLLIHKV